MKAIILSGGLGLRLRPMTDDKPKSLISIDGRPIAEHQIEWLLKSKEIDGIIFACGYRWERLKEHFGSSYNGIPISYSIEDEPLGTGGAIKKALSMIRSDEGEFIALNGDIITNLDLKKMIDWHRNSIDTAVTMLLVPYRSRFGVVYIDKLRTVRKFEEKPEFPDVWINGGVYVINLRKIMKYLPDKGDIEVETFPKLVPYGQITGFPYYGNWWIIDTIKDLKEVENELRAQV